MRDKFLINFFPVNSASHVDERIEEFLNQFNLNLEAMTESELQTRVQSLIKLKQVPDVSLDEEVSRNWNEILSEEYLFDRLQQEVCIHFQVTHSKKCCLISSFVF